MTAERRCTDRFEDLVASVMGELDALAATELREHLAVCDACRETHDLLAEEETEIRLGFESLARSLGPMGRPLLEHRHDPSSVRIGPTGSPLVERVKKMVFAHRQLSVVAAVVTALAAGVIVHVSLISSPWIAYALEQTVLANRRVTSYHARITPAAELGEVWVQLDPDGDPLRARLNLQSPDDGAKVVIFSQGKAEIWLKDKNSRVFVQQKDALEVIERMRHLADPKLAFEKLQAAKESGKVQVDAKEPSEEGGPITLTATPKDPPDRREVYEIAPHTKLVERLTRYRREGGRWEQVEMIEYLDYNRAIDPSVFELDLPADVMTVDQIQQKPGLEKGDLTDPQIATKVVREFFEALIAKDYERAGSIYSGVPGERIKEGLGQREFLRIVEIGEAEAHPKTRSLQVPVKVELRADGGREVRQFSPLARPVHGQPDRWEIIGGI